jgi:DNA-binding transcriptional ArsR family regulator
MLYGIPSGKDSFFSNQKINRNIAINKYPMGVSSIEKFSEQENRIARYAKALGHPARVAILQLLVRKQACICGDIVDELPLSQSTVSQHLKELKEAGLIKGDIEGAKVCYCINEEAWEQAREALTLFFDAQTGVKTSCC